MPEYIDREKLVRDLIDNRSFYPAIVKNAIENAPTEDVVPRSTIVEMLEELKERMETSSLCSLDIEEMEGLIADAKEKYIGE